jgi:hypothetical protein
MFVRLTEKKLSANKLCAHSISRQDFIRYAQWFNSRGKDCYTEQDRLFKTKQ